MKIHYNKDFECYMVAECHKTNVIELDGVKLIPIEELKKIKAEITQTYETNKYFGVEEHDSVIEIIDNHIEEMKGDSNG